MKNYKLSDLLRDYDFVSRVLENHDNKRSHIPSLNTFVKNFELKYSHLYRKHREYFISTRLKLDNLKLKLRNNQTIENED